MLEKIYHKKTIPYLIFFCVFTLYLLTMPADFNGYEGETANAAKALLKGLYQVKRAGLGAVFMYLPFVGIDLLAPSLVKLTIVPIFYSALAISIFYLICLKLTKNTRASLAVSILAAIGSIVWPYSSLGMEYQTTLLLGLLLYSLLVWSAKLDNPVYVGLVLAFLSITKSYGCIFLLPTACYIFFILRQQGKLYLIKQARFLFSFVLPATLALVLVLLLNHALYQKISGAYLLGHEFQIWTWWEGFYGILFSFGKSIFIYNPLLLLAVFYWPRFYKNNKPETLFVVSSFILLMFITAPFSYWSDETWGVRKIVPAILLLHLPLLIFLTDKKRHLLNAIFTILLVVSIYVQILGSTFSVGRYLAILRVFDKDSQATMRYIPTLSHIVVNHHLFLSYLNKQITGQSNEFSYTETTWFRWTAKLPDIDLVKNKTSLEKYDQIDIFWLKEGQQQKTIWLFLAVGLMLNTLWLVKIYQKQRSYQSNG